MISGRTIIAAALIIAFGSILGGALTYQRYSFSRFPDSPRFVYRLDNWTGRISVCTFADRTVAVCK